MTARCVRDLKLAADFVKSVETGDTLVNFELRELANMIESVAKRLDLSIEELEAAEIAARSDPLDAA
jgi:Holliday junction resolvasome RuvABC ATP-dependent DNA helicase subunit